MIRGHAAVAIAITAVAAVMIGTGWLLSAFLEARSDIRSFVAVAPSPNRLLARSGAPADDLTGQTIAYKHSPAPEPLRFSETRTLEPVGALAQVIPVSFQVLADASDDRLTTGSLGASTYALAVPDIAAASRLVLPPKLDDRPPLPRARPRLAALGPIQGLGPIRQEEDSSPSRTAIYDITAQVVYLPSGERLEAHSGLGQFMDDPRYVREKNRGATPPNTYQLKLRESLFHGVQAVRLTPVGEGEMFNRDGILAHSYMLGPSGQSNGCVSFKDYPKFLRAFLRGEFDRMIVVTRLTRPPTFATRPNARSASSF